MPKLLQQRCLNHPEREAVSRCPGCQRFFCRECVTEHDGRVLCRECLAVRHAPAARGGMLAWLRWALGGAGGFLLAWAAFYYLGSLLARIPAQFHGAAQ